jgi:hypothetical protein
MWMPLLSGLQYRFLEESIRLVWLVGGPWWRKMDSTDEFLAFMHIYARLRTTSKPPQFQNSSGGTRNHLP